MISAVKIKVVQAIVVFMKGSTISYCKLSSRTKEILSTKQSSMTYYNNFFDCLVKTNLKSFDMEYFYHLEYFHLNHFITKIQVTRDKTSYQVCNLSRVIQIEK